MQKRKLGNSKLEITIQGDRYPPQFAARASC
jgi:hypothetical protein